MQVYLQVERGRVAVGSLTISGPEFVPLPDQTEVELHEDSACVILVGTVAIPPPGVVLTCLHEADLDDARRPGVFIAETVARFHAEPPCHGQPGKVVLESYFPENCSLRRPSKLVAGVRPYELQTPEGAVLFSTQVRAAELAPSKG